MTTNAGLGTNDDFTNALGHRVLVLDGAMGTMIQKYKLDESDFRGKRFSEWKQPLKGCNDVLVLTKPEIISEIHRAYIEAGADIIETNSFNANAISLADYGLADMVKGINITAARVARQCADSCNRKCWVAGSIGPTNRSLSISPSVENPALRNLSWDELTETYCDQISGLIEGGVDILLIETVFDTLNAKAALWAANKVMNDTGKKLPIMVSATLTESGRILSGQTIEAFLVSIEHANVTCVGLNCGFGAKKMAEWLEELADKSPVAVSVHPNAGLPNEMGEYDQSPEEMAGQMKPFIEKSLVNIVGGCCGTTPDHIRAIAAITAGATPKHIAHHKGNKLVLSGFESMEVSPERCFVNIGERCNVAGSRKFLRLINEKNYDEALSVASKQVENGAQIIDVNMDDAMLDAPREMSHFLRLVASDPDVAKVPIMIDSSNWNVITAGLKELQGKGIVNSISLKDGEQMFIDKARYIRDMGAAVVVMAFDEKGQADTFERKIEICRRAYDLLISRLDFKPQDIIFDPNVLAIATGMEQHADYALDFLKAVEWIKDNLPGAKVSGGISNLSFSFRGNNFVREAMHSAFLFHAIARGLDMAIVNAAAAMPYDDIPPKLRATIEDVIFNRTADATDRLVEEAAEIKEKQNPNVPVKNDTSTDDAELDVSQKLEQLVVRGSTENLEELLDKALSSGNSAISIIDRPLMKGMDRVGKLFGEGRMFLPQVVKSARIMKLAVNKLTPFIEAERKSGSNARAGKMVLATVKGDVHDIGKNIVAIIMRCNGYDVTDLGVMVPADKIIETAIAEHADLIGLSGLITPSLEEMCHVAKAMEERHIDTPLFVGGATTSDIHTAIKIAPLYHGPVIHTRDAAALPVVAKRLFSDNENFISELNLRYAQLRKEYSESHNLMSLTEARSKRLKLNFSPVKPSETLGIHHESITVSEAAEYINWKAFFAAWKLGGDMAGIANVKGCDCCKASWLASHDHADMNRASQAMQLFKEAQKLLSYLIDTANDSIKATYGLWEACSQDDDIMISTPDGKRTCIPTLRQQHLDSGGNCTLSLADFIAPADSGTRDFIGTFAVSTGTQIERIIEYRKAKGEEYEALLIQTIADRLAEAATELLHARIRTRHWGYSVEEDLSPASLLHGKYQGIRPAVGYPSLPDQSIIFNINDFMPLSGSEIEITENGAMRPASSTCGLIIAHPDSRYFMVGIIGDDQKSDYARRRNIPVENLSQWLR